MGFSKIWAQMERIQRPSFSLPVVVIAICGGESIDDSVARDGIHGKETKG